jgi:hypothetical protein
MHNVEHGDLGMEVRCHTSHPPSRRTAALGEIYWKQDVPYF